MGEGEQRGNWTRKQDGEKVTRRHTGGTLRTEDWEKGEGRWE